MMSAIKKISFVFLCCIGLLHSDEYPSLHQGTFLNSLLTNTTFMNNGAIQINYGVNISSYSEKSATSGLPFYPNGWNKFKVYAPAGVWTVVTFSTYPNQSIRVDTKFRGDVNNIIDHFHPQTTVFYDDSQPESEEIIINSAQYYRPSLSTGGWIYFDVLNDRLNTPAEHPEYTGIVEFRIRLQYTKDNNEYFNNWLTSTFFLTPGGDPSAAISSMEIIDVPTENTPVSRQIPLDYGGALYDGTPISSISSSGVSSSVASSNSSLSQTSSIASSVGSSTSNPCPAGQYLSQDTGGCVGSSSSIFSSASSSFLPYCDTISSSSSISSSNTGGILPRAVTCIVRPTSSSSTSNPCPIGQIISQDTGGCVSISIGGASSSSSSSSSVATQNASTALQAGWNLISIPIATNQEIDVNTTLNGKATIAYKFDANATSVWEKWLPGVSMKLRNGEGLFAGVPADSTAQSINFSVVADTNSTKFESTSYNVNTWYLLGFGYDITVETIKTKYPNSVIFTMENGAYLKQDANTTIIENGIGFWFKYYDTNSSI